MARREVAFNYSKYMPRQGQEDAKELSGTCGQLFLSDSEWIRFFESEMGLHWVVIWKAFPGGGTESDEKRNRVVVVLAEGLTREELEEKPM